MKLLPFTWKEIERQERKPLIVCVVSILCLVAIRFFSSSSWLLSADGLFRPLGLSSSYEVILYYLQQDEHQLFWQMFYWVMITIFFYLVVPAGVIKFVFKERMEEYGLKRKEVFGYFRTYLMVIGLLFPIVFWASYSSAFQIAYPFYIPLDKRDMFPYFIIWECFYLLQFLALEFFFRGFMIHGLKKYLGVYSILVMMTPYCMIHFNKPIAECLGSIIAGLFLGMMSYKTGSIWMGALTHMAVAVSMDVLSLWHRGFL